MEVLIDTNENGQDILDDLLDVGLSLSEFTTAAKNRGVYVVQPDDVITTDFRTDNSRFFPEVKNGIVVGGGFQ